MKLYLLSILLCIISIQTFSQNLYVDSSNVVSGNGGSWATSFNSLSDALDSAMKNSAIEKIFVAKGTYYATKYPYQINTNLTGTQIASVKNKEKVFHIRCGLEVFGGYPSGGGQQNSNLNPTVLTAAKVGGVIADTAYHVIYVTNYRWTKVNDTTRIDGFVIRDAKANTTTNAETYTLISLNSGGIIHNYGAGFYIDMNSGGNSNVCVIAQNLIRNNYVTRSAAGIFTVGGDIIVDRNIITMNSASNSTNDNCDGVGLYANGSKILISNNLISNNFNSLTSFGFGVGVMLNYAIGIVRNNVFDNNVSVMSAGALGIGSSTAKIESNYFINNKAGSAGGAIYVSVGTDSIINNVFYGNKSFGPASFSNGGGAVFTSVSKSFICNNNFVNNYSSSNGGALYTAKSDTNNIINNIFWGNQKSGVNSVAGADYQNSTVYNSVNVFKSNFLQLPANNYVTSDVGAYAIGNSASGNYYAIDPKFKDTTSILGTDGLYRTFDDGLSVETSSICINAGNNIYVANIDYDIKGSKRLQNAIVDIGAYEGPYNTIQICYPEITISSDVGVIICSGTVVNFAAQTSFSGTSPTFKWYVNNLLQGNTSSVFSTNSIQQGDKIKAEVLSNDGCSVGFAASSNIINMSVNPTVNPSISISGTTTVTYGQSALINSARTNAGSAPSYQWQDSTSVIGWTNITTATNSTFNYSPTLNGSKLRCRLTSNAVCANPSVVFSNSLVFTVNTPTGITDPQNPAMFIRITPNPASQLLSITGLSTSKVYQYILSDYTGRSLLNGNISQSSHQQINIHTIPSGVYILRLYNVQQRKLLGTEKIIVVH